MTPALGFLVMLKLLAVLASAMIAGTETGAYLDFTGELVVHLHREGGHSGVSLWLRPDAWIAMVLRLLTWQELVFQTWLPWMYVMSFCLTVWSGYVVVSQFPGGIGGVARGVFGLFRR